MALEDPRDVVRWLLAPRNQRELEVLEVLEEGEFRARDLQERLGLDHPQKLYRSLEYLQDRGLVSQFHDLSGDRRGATYEISPIGSRILDAVHEVQDLLSEGGVEVERELVQSTTSGVRIRVRTRRARGDQSLPSLDQTIHLTDAGVAVLEIGSFSDGSPEEELVVRA